MEKVCTVILECCGLDASDARWSPFISSGRREKLDRINLESGKLLSLGAELALCAALHMRGLPFRPPEYYRGVNGKPFLSNAPQYISISHSGSLAVCAVADVPVGVDIETPRRVDMRIARRILSPEEYSDDISAAGLLRKWVIKESWLKLTGEGISGSMSSVTAKSGSIFHSGNADAHYKVIESTSPDYILSYCCREPFETETLLTDLETLFVILSK